MIDISLISVNWNNRPCLELMLKSYVKHHPAYPLKVVIVDNGSTDGSKEWLKENHMPFVDLPENLGHENALNHVFPHINAKWVQLVDTDWIFEAETHQRIDNLHRAAFVSWGEYIDNQWYEAIKIHNRVSPWFWAFDYRWVRQIGVDVFRDPECEDWTIDVGSWLTARMLKESPHGHANMMRQPGDQDRDLISMVYPGVGSHIGKCSWDIEQHMDRFDEVMRRREWVLDKLKEYDHIELAGKFISGLKNTNHVSTQ